MNVILTIKAKRQLYKLHKNIQERILKKVYRYAAYDDPLKFAEPLTNSSLGKYRYRIGDYRVFLTIEKEEEIRIMLVVNIRKRNEKTYS